MVKGERSNVYLNLNLNLNLEENSYIQRLSRSWLFSFRSVPFILPIDVLLCENGKEKDERYIGLLEGASLGPPQYTSVYGQSGSTKPESSCSPHPRPL